MSIFDTDLPSDWLSEFEETAPDTVFHYTDGVGLLGILKNKKLRCTHIAYMNDSKEWIHSGDLISDALLSIKRDPNCTARQKEYVDVAFGQINYNPMNGPASSNQLADPDQEFPPIFVASFSRRRDDLNMWRGYSVRNARYSIELKTEALKSIEDHYKSFCKFKPVCYEEDRLKQHIRNTLIKNFEASDSDEYMHHPETKELRKAQDSVAGALKRLINQIRSRIGPIAKHEKFNIEAEWRLWTWGAPTCFRSGELFLIPYAELPLDSTAFESITLGPTSQPLLSERSLKQFLACNNLSHVQVIRSDIPYRS